MRNDLYCLPGKVWGDGVLTPETSSRVTYAPLVASSRRCLVKQQWFFSTQRRRGIGDSSLGVLCASVVIPWTSSRVTHAPLYSVFQTLLSNNSGSFQHRVAEASEILLSGSSLPLWLNLGLHPGLLAPFVASSRRFPSNSGGSFQH